MSELRKCIRPISQKHYLVFDRYSDRQLGRILNMSPEGILLATEKPLPVPDVIPCRMEFPEKSYNQREITFDAETRWCRFNQKTELYEMGLYISFDNRGMQELAEELIYSWMVGRGPNLRGIWTRRLNSPPVRAQCRTHS